ncbi:camp-dependent protein kinase-like protein regulatory subunit [Eremomyces bilateralis CBS 781.70]|uniref:cAMP-dependent protein kinase regulatory subunit n=1 Tax=Eremomyces bilateralis CBS 781.70 TaxID=1392243 RepID=A0A6G1FVN9_9PEZI|nr:camp-dependent protein kinase-like protein regulatory subunit [Eremomyces bilateralis CBS 781.70]KAF1809731.1 camp-dependent protein kinase-like protein regulatory subunit [Eremomyces bilateralis CBS 781.70]
MSLPPEYFHEINTLNREFIEASPDDILQFCADYFQRRLASQRHEFLVANPQSRKSGMVDPNIRGMQALQEDEAVASPTASSFPSNPFDTTMNASNPRDAGNGTTADGHQFNFGGFSASVGAPPSGGGDASNFPNNYNLNRRISVSAESLDPASTFSSNWVPPFYPKTKEQQTRLTNAVAQNFLFAHLDEEQSSQVLGALQEKRIPAKGVKVIEQGAEGDNFYVVESGTFDVFVHPSGKIQPGIEGLGNNVGTVGAGGSFGELALMYNAPRAASVVSAESSTLWALDRVTFRRILMDSAFQRRRMYEKFLEEVPLFVTLTPYERSKIADALESKKYPPGTTIIREGDPGDAFYIVEQGEAEVFKRGADKPINRIEKGGYFGELALLDDQPRAASVISKSEVKVATMGKDAFQRLLGPVESIMRRNDPRRGQAGMEEVDPLSKE